MVEDYTYAALCRMKKSRVIRIAGYMNIKKLMIDLKDKKDLKYKGDNLSKKYIARMIASDR